MSVKDAQTYGEYFWKMQVEAETLNDELLEEEISPLVQILLGDIAALDELPDGMRRILQTLAAPTGAKLGGMGANMFGEILGNSLGTILEQPLKKSGYAMGAFFLGERIDAPTTALLWQRKKIEQEMYEQRYTGLGFPAEEWNAFYAAQQPYPTIPELVTFARYHGNPDAPWGVMQEWFDVSPKDWPVWKWLSLQRLTTEQIHTLYRRGLISNTQALTEFAQVGWSQSDRILQQELGWSVPNAMLMVQGDLMYGKSRDVILQDIALADINPKYAQTYLDAVLTKPASQDVVNYTLRTDPSLSTLDAQLQRIGIHPDYIDMYKTLAYQIPPLGDLISMAVREVFSPEIARRFGQFEDFPDDFERYAGQKGLSKEWALNYWAAHWSLPSISQGFEMLHRGIIDQSELSMLLRALDVMPFWRDRLVEMSFKPFTRVDVRRMYKQGVLDESEVFQAYLDVGYDDERARKMTEFTIRQTLATMSKFTTGDVVTAYTKRLASRGEATALLKELGVRPEDISFILSTADYKLYWAQTEQKIRGIRNLYKRQVYSEDKTRDQLAGLDLPSDRINTLIEQWWYEKKEEEAPTWTKAETLRFLKKDLISKPRAIQELLIMGYDGEHIQVYLEDKK